MQMRGGTSKGAYFLRDDLPHDAAGRDDLLLRIMGSPDARQIDGIGGAHPLTSKVAVVSRSEDPDADVDYLFLQVVVDEPIVTDRQNCGNILAGVGPFAIERGLVQASGDATEVRIKMLNTNSLAVATVQTPNGRVRYAGDTRIAGVPQPAEQIVVDFYDTAGSSTGALLPTGRARDTVAGVDVTCVDNGMPVVTFAAHDVGVTGHEAPAELEGNAPLREKLEQIRLEAGELMGLGDVRETTVPKLTLLSEPEGDGTVATRTFIPHRCHASIGVLGAVSVATAVAVPGSVAGEVARGNGGARMRLEHPSGFFDTEVELERDGDEVRVRRSGVVLTARKLFDGTVFPWTP